MIELLIRWMNETEEEERYPKMNGTLSTDICLFLQKARKLHLMPKSSVTKTTSFPKAIGLEEGGIEGRINY